jgi:excisionase family DNA binding protein
MNGTACDAPSLSERVHAARFSFKRSPVVDEQRQSFPRPWLAPLALHGASDPLRLLETLGARNQARLGHQSIAIEAVGDEPEPFSGQFNLALVHALLIPADRSAGVEAYAGPPLAPVVRDHPNKAEDERPRQLRNLERHEVALVRLARARPRRRRRNIGRNTRRRGVRFRCGMTSHTETRYRGTPTAPLLTINDVAHQLAISRDSVYRLLRSGTLPALRVGERLRFRPSDIEAYLERGRVKAP